MSEAARTTVHGLGPMVVVLWVGDSDEARVTAAAEQGKGWHGRDKRRQVGQRQGMIWRDMR